MFLEIGSSLNRLISFWFPLKDLPCILDLCFVFLKWLPRGSEILYPEQLLNRPCSRFHLGGLCPHISCFSTVFQPCSGVAKDLASQQHLAEASRRAMSIDYCREQGPMSVSAGTLRNMWDLGFPMLRHMCQTPLECTTAFLVVKHVMVGFWALRSQLSLICRMTRVSREGWPLLRNFPHLWWGFFFRARCPCCTPPLEESFSTLRV